MVFILPYFGNADVVTTQLERGAGEFWRRWDETTSLIAEEV